MQVKLNLVPWWWFSGTFEFYGFSEILWHLAEFRFQFKILGAADVCCSGVLRVCVCCRSFAKLQNTWVLRWSLELLTVQFTSDSVSRLVDWLLVSDTVHIGLCQQVGWLAAS